MTDPREQLVDAIAPHVHVGQYVDAGRIVSEFVGKPSPSDEQHARNLCSSVADWCLENSRLDLAARLYWPPSLFDPRPNSVRRIWASLRDHQFTLLPGASSMGKTYTPGVYFFLEWLSDPKYTQVIAVGPGEEHLESNLFTHLHKLHSEACLPVPGERGKLFIGADRRDMRAAIRGTVIPLGRGKGAGKLQGSKRHPRPVPHPVHGKMSRLLIILDELENVPIGVYADLENIVSNVISSDDRGIRIVGAYNPKDKTKPPYTLSAPKQGWKHVNADSDHEWDSVRGFHVVRLDAYQSENIIENRLLFPGLQSAAGFAALVKNAGGIGSNGYWTFGRGMYPPDDNARSVIPERLLSGAVGKPVWVGRPEGCAGVDLALEGGDRCVFTPGLFGHASGVLVPPAKPGDPDKLFAFVDAQGAPLPRRILVVQPQIELPRGDTVSTATEIRRLCGALSIKPEWACLDRTGNGAGVHDVLKALWSTAVRGLNYSENPTGLRVIQNDEKTPLELYFDASTELYFAAAAWLEHRFLWFDPSVGIDGSVLAEELTGRLNGTGEKGRSRIEGKKVYKSRGKSSPDRADSFTLLLHAVRVESGVSIEAAESSGLTSQPLPVHALGDRRERAPTVDFVNDMRGLDIDFDESAGARNAAPAGVHWDD